MRAEEAWGEIWHIIQPLLSQYLPEVSLATWDFNPVTNEFTADARYTEWFGILAEESTDNILSLQAIAGEDRERVIAAYTRALDYSSGFKYYIEFKIRPKINQKEFCVQKEKRGLMAS